MDAAITVGIDGSEESLRAVAWAGREALRRKAPLRVVHALPKWAASSPSGSRYPEIGDWWRQESDRIARQAVEQVERDFPGITVESAVLPGDPAAVLADQAASAGVLVVGSQGMGALRGLLLGSVGLKLAGRVPCPLVVVRGADPADHDQIVVGIDGSPHSADALEFAFRWAAPARAGIRALLAWQAPIPPVAVTAVMPVMDMESYEQDAKRILGDALEPLQRRHPDVEVTAGVVNGHPVSVLEEASGGAGLLVVGARGLGGLKGLVLGSVSHGLLHRARCPIAIVPGGD